MSKKWKVKKICRLMKETDSNRTYNVARKFSEHVSCIVCMGPCWGRGPYRANKFKRNCGRKPRGKKKPWQQ